MLVVLRLLLLHACESPSFIPTSLLLLVLGTVVMSAAESTVHEADDPSCPDCIACSSSPSSSPVGRPYFRSALARSVYRKIQTDEDFAHFDQNEWYKIRMEALDKEEQDLFVQLDKEDEETAKFLDQCRQGSDAVFTQLFHLVGRTVLAPFLSQTSINGLLRRGSMFVLSAQQFRRLFRLADDYRAGSLLDLGAGDGATTALLGTMFDSVHVTEVSWPMKRILAARGFTVQDVEGWSQQGPRYDVICALNLLDRCSRPLTLLDQMKASLKPGGLALVALVWPFKPYVESTSDHMPEEALTIRGRSMEEQVTSLIRLVLRPKGFRILGWSKVPYLCEGDLERTFYHLTDILVALKVEDG